MEKPILKTLTRPVNQIDEVDCAINWEVFECPYCDGSGGVKDDFPESETYGEDMDCDQCDGSGLVGVLKK